MKLRDNIMILSLFIVILCCISSVTATEDVSDKIEISDEDIDVEQLNNNFINDNEINEKILSSNQQNENIIKDSEVFNEIYVNSSSSNSFGDVDGHSWEQAYGQDNGLYWAYESINNNGVIHIANGKYEANLGNMNKNVTFIAQSNNTIFVSLSNHVTALYNPDPTLTFINFTIKNATLSMNSNFINCTFIDSRISISEDVYKKEHIDETPFAVTYYMYFDNCTFKDVNTIDDVMTLYKYCRVNFNNCTFENITAGSIISCISSFVGVMVDIHNCTFKDLNIKGVVYIDEYNQNLVLFENNDGDVNLFVSPPDDSKITLTATVDSLIILLKDCEGNIIKNASVVISAPSHDPNFIRTVKTNDEGIAVYNFSGTDWFLWCADYDGNKFFYGSAEASINLKTLAKTLNVQFTNVTDVTGKTMLVVTVKNNLSEIVSNTNFTFTLNGNEYNATTDVNGQFIASGLTGEVSVGVKYNGAKYNALDTTTSFTFPKTESEENTLSGNTTRTDDKKLSQSNNPAKKVTLVATKLTAKKTTFKVKKKAKKYTIILKAGKKAVSKVKVTLKVGKKTYKATTNKKGKAIFNLKKLTKKGKYTAVIKFKGNKNYKATSKKVKIIVK